MTDVNMAAPLHDSRQAVNPREADRASAEAKRACRPSLPEWHLGENGLSDLRHA